MPLASTSAAGPATSLSPAPPLRFYFTTIGFVKLKLKPPLSYNSTTSPPFLPAIPAEKQVSRFLVRSSLSSNSGTENINSVSPGYLSLDAVLAAAEILLVVPPVICSLKWAVEAVMHPNSVRPLQLSIGSKTLVLQNCFLVLAVVVGCVLRRRQWERLYRVDRQGQAVSLVGRIERMEEQVRGSATVIRMLSKHLEKLAVRFRVTKRSMRDPIAEAALLAQKNSEATRALAMQEDVLEKELGEVQNIILAMQEQQQKQLDLILTVAKAVHLLDGKHASQTEETNVETGDSASSTEKVAEQQQIEVQYGHAA